MFHNSRPILLWLSMGMLAAQPDYDRDNPIATLAQTARGVSLAAGSAFYVGDSLHYLFPILAYGLPSEDRSIPHDGRASTQEALRTYQLGDYFVVKGLLQVGGAARNFLKIGYTAPSGQPLTLEVKVNAISRKVPFPYRAEDGGYSVEFWNLPDAAALPPSLRADADRGRIVLDPAFPPGNPLDYRPARVKGTMWEAGDPNDINHPLRAARISFTLAGPAGPVAGPHTVAYKMIRRGFDAFRSDRSSPHPHGGTGATESILFYNAESNDPDHILRQVAAGRPLASGEPAAAPTVERFFPAKYMQYVRFGPSASIGIHRHKDFLDAFWVARGSGLGVVIDAIPLDGTAMTVELRRLRAFEGMIVRPGQMHGLLRDSDEPLEMFAFGAAN